MDEEGIVTVFAGGGTGGHLYPALTLAEALVELRPQVRPFFVGAERGIEAEVLPRKGVEYALLPARPIDRSRPWRNVGVLVVLLEAIRSVARLFRRLSPAAVVVTGGYAGAPAGVWAAISGIPLALQEQNSYPGVTTRWLARWARQIHLGFPEAREHLPRMARERSEALGNPIRPPRDVGPEEARRSFGLEPSATVVLVVGGSQGARAINELLLEALVGWRDDPDGVSALSFIWSTGPDHRRVVEEGLAGHPLRERLHVTGFLHDMPSALAAADLALSRAGAMVTAELTAWGLPAILVPLPGSAADHQERNARALAEAGAAVHLPQPGLTASRLWSTLIGLASDPVARGRMAEKARRRGRPHAAREIASRLQELLPSDTTAGDSR